jgi:hypothetical protein
VSLPLVTAIAIAVFYLLFFLRVAFLFAGLRAVFLFVVFLLLGAAFLRRFGAAFLRRFGAAFFRRFGAAFLFVVFRAGLRFVVLRFAGLRFAARRFFAGITEVGKKIK